MATYSHACLAMNSSVPGAVSPPLIVAAAARMPTITATIAQNSVVLNACFVSVERRRTTDRPAGRSTLAPAARVVADSMVNPPIGLACSKLGQARLDETGDLGSNNRPQRVPHGC